MSAITKLFGKMRAKTFAPGEILIEEGGAKGKLYVLESGELGVLRGGIEVATVSQPGALVGEISALLDSPPSATVKAKTNGKAYIVTNPVGRLLDDPALLLHVARLLASRLAETTEYLAKSRQARTKVSALLRDL
jgi:CRP-like cAMP-binding protein